MNTSPHSLGEVRPQRITVVLPSDLVDFLQVLAQRDGSNFTLALRSAIRAQQFFIEQEDRGGRILIDTDGELREVNRRR